MFQTIENGFVTDTVINLKEGTKNIIRILL